MLFFQRRVAFVHHQINENLGDKLCTPKLYFKFSRPSRDSTAIVGGGAWEGFGVPAAKQIKAKHKVLWGVGVSLNADRPKSGVDLMALARLYEFRSTRDPDWASDDMPLVPCPSVFHPICELPPGDKDGIFLNGNPASGPSAPEILDTLRRQGFVAGTNFLSEKSFSAAFAQTRRVITNSYHIAYWALLSGRSINPLGYSSKFESLMRLFGLPPSAVISYRKGEDIGPLVRTAISASPLVITAHETQRELFRKMNIDFATSLSGLFNDVAPCRY